MADETIPAIGISVGATTLAAVTADHAVTRRPVLTLYQDHSAQVGVPSETEESPAEQGLVITDFVNRVGDSAPVVATDGSARRGEQLLADALHSLAYVATEGGPLPAAVAVSHPAHWSAAAVDALSAALGRVPQWSQSQLPVISDVSAALTALKADPGLPVSGIVAVCDFGGTGTSITLVDAARGYQPIGATARYTDFSGEVIDQALLNYVVADLSANGSLDETSGVGGAGSLTRLRGQCRCAKERLSSDTVTGVTVDLPGFRGDTWVTRAELDEVIRQPFDGFITAVREAIDRSRVPVADLIAIAAVGGGANIPAVTAGLGQRLGVAVIASPRPQLAAAIGAALRVTGRVAGVRGAPDVAAPPSASPSSPSSPAAPAAPAAPSPEQSSAPPPQPAAGAREAWPQPEPSVWQQQSQPVAQLPPIEPAWQHLSESDAVTSPEPAAEYEPFPDGSGRTGNGWYRRPVPVILGVALAVLLLGVVAVIALRHAASTEPAPPAVTPEPTQPAEPHDQPALPAVPSLPSLPALPSLPEIPGITAVPPAPESPESPETPESPGAPEGP